MGLMVPFENQSKAPHVRYTPRRTIHLNTGGENSAKNTIVIKLITIELIGTIQKLTKSGDILAVRTRVEYRN